MKNFMKRAFLNLELILTIIITIIVNLIFSFGCSLKPTVSQYQGHGSESVKNEKTKQFAAKELPLDLSRKIQNYMDVRSPGLGMIHPKDNKKLFFGWRVTGIPQVWKLDEPKGFPIQMTGGEDLTVLVGITPDGKWLVLNRDRAGEENPGLYLQSTEGGALKPIQHLPKIQTVLGHISKDSRYVFYRSNDREPDSYAIYRYDIEKGVKELIFSEKGVWFISDVNEKKFLLAKATGSLWREYYELNIETKELIPLLGQGEKELYEMKYSEKDSEFFVLTNKFSDFSKVYRWNRHDKKFVVFKNAEVNGEIEDMVLDEERNKLILSYSLQGYGKIHGVNLKTGEKIDFPEFPEADQVYTGSISLDGQNIMIGIETHNQPRSSYSYNFKTKQLTKWVVPSQPEVDTSSFVRSKLEYYPTRDGAKIPVFISTPEKCVKGKMLCPVIVHFHGGPEGQSSPGFSLFAQSFVNEGFVFAEPNVRGSSGYGKAWLASDDGPKRLQVVSDIEDASVYFKKEYSVNGQSPKIGVMGGSYGGYSTLMAMTRFAGAYDVGVSNVGMSNLVTFLQNTAPYRRILRMSEYGDLEKDKEALIQLSPTTYLNKIKSPLMIIQGVSDPRVPVGEALQIHEALKEKGIQNELILFSDEGHGAQKRGNQVLQWGHELLFFIKHLKELPEKNDIK